MIDTRQRLHYAALNFTIKYIIYNSESMKHIFAIAVVALMALFSAPEASAYSEEIAQLAEEMNKVADDGTTVEYDGNNVIFNFPQSFFSDDEMAVFAEMDDLQPLAPLMVQTLSNSMDAEVFNMLGTVLEYFNTNMVMRFNVNSTVKDMVLTPQQLLEK